MSHIIRTILKQIFQDRKHNILRIQGEITHFGDQNVISVANISTLPDFVKGIITKKQ